MSLLIVGSIAMDTVETPQGGMEDALGGSAVYGAYAASLFTKPCVVGVVGDDYPQRQLENMREKGIDTEGIETVQGGKTFRWGGRYLENMNDRETLFTELNVLETFSPKLPDSYREVPNIFLANIDPDLQLQVLEQIKKPRFVVCDTMNLWIDIKRPSLMKLLGKIDALLLNDEEARMLADTLSLTEAANRMRAEGVGRVIIKKGEHGALMFSEEGCFAAPALPLLDVKDPTGAGDTFAGGMLGWLAAHPLTESNWRKSIVVGTAMASFCVEDFSVQQLVRVTEDSLRERADQLRDMMKVGAI